MNLLKKGWEYLKRTPSVAAGALATLSMKAALAAPPAIDVSAATGYIDSNGASSIVAVGTSLFTLAAVALIVRWVKATFFG